MRKCIIALSCLLLLALLFPSAITFAQTEGTVTRSVSNSQPSPGETVTVSITQSGITSFYAVKESIGSLVYTGENTADSNPEGTTFTNIAPKDFTYKIKIPSDAKPGYEFVITGTFWSDPQDKREIGKTVLEVPGGCQRGGTELALPASLDLSLDSIVYVKSGTTASQLGPEFAWVNDDTVLIVEDRTMSEGSTVQIPINLVNADNLANMDIKLTYDSNVLCATEVLEGSLIKDTLFESNIMDGTILIAFAANAAMNGTGSIALLQFDVIGNKGDCSVLGITAVGNNFTTRAEIDLTSQNGVFKVGGDEIKGDLDGNGDANIVDALSALQMAGANREVKLVGDMNEDGQVTSSDASEILKMANESAIKAVQDKRGWIGALPVPIP